MYKICKDTIYMAKIMNVFKTFTEPDSIKRALEKMLEYPFDERPLLNVKFDVGGDQCYVEGPLFAIDYMSDYIIITIGTPSNTKSIIELDSITKLYIFDVKAE